MRKLIYGMNLTLDGYVAAPSDDLGWSGRATSRSSCNVRGWSAGGGLARRTSS